MTGVKPTTISFPHSLNVSSEKKEGAPAKERSNERALGNERHAFSSVNASPSTAAPTKRREEKNTRSVVDDAFGTGERDQLAVSAAHRHPSKHRNGVGSGEHRSQHRARFPLNV